MDLLQPFSSPKRSLRLVECSSQSWQTLSPHKDHHTLKYLLLALQMKNEGESENETQEQEHKNFQQLKNTRH